MRNTPVMASAWSMQSVESDELTRGNVKNLMRPDDVPMNNDFPDTDNEVMLLSPTSNVLMT